MDGLRFFDLSHEHMMSQDNLWIVDISDQTNNTARSAFRFAEI